MKQRRTCFLLHKVLREKLQEKRVTKTAIGETQWKNCLTFLHLHIFCAFWLMMILDNSNYTTLNCYWILFQKGKNEFIVRTSKRKFNLLQKFWFFASFSCCYFSGNCYLWLWRHPFFYPRACSLTVLLSASAASQIYKPGEPDTGGISLRKERASWLQKRHMNSSSSSLNKQNVDVCGELNICISLRMRRELWKRNFRVFIKFKSLTKLGCQKYF